jgi:hypothetical protein
MTDADLALTVISAVIGAVVAFAALWYPIERRQREAVSESMGFDSLPRSGRFARH